MVRVAVFVQPFAAVPVTVYVVVVAGETETEVPLIAPGFHVYEVAPLPVSVVLLPEQIVVVAEVAVTVGDGLTVMVRVAVPVQPEDVPVTVYVVVVVGETVTGLPDNAPGFQVYEVAPLAVMVALLPAQIVVVEVVVVTVGVGLTVMVRVAVFVQPFAPVPVTVYVVVVVGETVTVVPVSAPGFHVYEVAPLPVSVVLLPEQIVVVADVAVTVGAGFTVIVRVAVLLQPLALVPVTV